MSNDAWDVVGPQPVLERTDAAQQAFDRVVRRANKHREAPAHRRTGEAHPIDWEHGGCTTCPKPAKVAAFTSTTDIEPRWFDGRWAARVDRRVVEDTPALPAGLVISGDGLLLNWRGENYVLQAASHLAHDEDEPDSGNPKDAIGDLKPPLHLVPAVLDIQVAQAMRNGAEKYGPYNWREKKVRAHVYIAAARRHLAAWFDGEDVASDSGIHHLAHAAACLAILLDAEATGNLIDDRPVPGAASRLIDEMTERAA